MLFAQIILPLSLKGTFTYEVPQELLDHISVGVRVEVQFGQRRHYAGIVAALTDIKPEGFRIKKIMDILDEKPVITLQQIELWHWISEYYMCYLGDVMQAALPTQLKLESTTIFTLNPDCETDLLQLDDDEYLVASALQHQSTISWEDISMILQKKHVVKTIKHLLEEGVLLVSEQIEDPYKPKLATFLNWTPTYGNSELAQRELLDGLINKAQQMRLVLAFIEEQRRSSEVLKTVLLKKSGVSSSVLNTLVKNGIFSLEEREISRVNIPKDNAEVQNALSKDQEQSLLEIKDFHAQGKAVLLHGVTASGKTHIYIELILQAKASGGQVLFLLPEIALTSQLIRRLNDILGGVGIYHSRMSQAERTEIWYKVLQGEIKIIVGARSALFLPFKDLKLIIVDEEHDPSFKQYDPSPRYQARDVALVMSKIYQANIILGSATPSVESYYNAETGRYGLVKLESTFYDSTKLKFTIESVKKGIQNQQGGTMITPAVRHKMDETLKAGKQIIVFQNRRGYAPYLTCATCSWIPHCKNCDVAMTYHKAINKLKCHYCGYMEKPPVRCKECDATTMVQRGVGTERIEDDLKLMFPKAQIGRLDQDAARLKMGHARITKAFEEHELDILVGTQMIAKGLDFSSVSLVIVPQVDSLLFYPDFRASERAFQLLYQVSGRAGRRKDPGEVCLQSARLDHPVLDWVIKRDFDGFYRQEIESRQTYNYPPFCRLVKFTFLHKDKAVAKTAAEIYVRKLSSNNLCHVLGPAEPYIGKVKNLYLYEVLVKIPRTSQAQQLKKEMSHLIIKLCEESSFRQLRVIADVDPG